MPVSPPLIQVLPASSINARQDLIGIYWPNNGVDMEAWAYDGSGSFQSVMRTASPPFDPSSAPSGQAGHDLLASDCCCLSAFDGSGDVWYAIAYRGQGQLWTWNLTTGATSQFDLDDQTGYSYHSSTMRGNEGVVATVPDETIISTIYTDDVSGVEERCVVRSWSPANGLTVIATFTQTFGGVSPGTVLTASIGQDSVVVREFDSPTFRYHRITVPGGTTTNLGVTGELGPNEFPADNAVFVDGDVFDGSVDLYQSYYLNGTDRSTGQVCHGGYVNSSTSWRTEVNQFPAIAWPVISGLSACHISLLGLSTGELGFFPWENPTSPERSRVKTAPLGDRFDDAWIATHAPTVDIDTNPSDDASGRPHQLFGVTYP